MHTDPDVAAAPGAPEVNARRPWLGLLPYKEEHREFFFGRDREVEDILGRIRDNSLTILYGQSGLGKSSLLAAGVVPKLREAGYVPRIIRLQYGEHRWPLLDQAKDSLIGATIGAKCGGFCADGETLWEMLHRVTFAPSAGVPVLIFDQFEEIFTLGAEPKFEQEVTDWWAQISDLLQNRPPQHLAERFANDRALAGQFHFGPAPIRIVLTLREDYLAQLESHKARLPLLMQNRMALALLTGPQARQAVLGPAQLGDHSLVSREVAESIVRRVANVPADTPLAQIKAVPPLLSLLCEQLNAARLNNVASALAEPHPTEDIRLKSKPHSQITAQSVHEQSTDILQRFYEDSFLSFPARHRPAIWAFVESILITETDPAYRNTVVAKQAHRDLAEKGVPDPSLVFDTLIQRRLITGETRDNVQRLEITHDVLVPLIVASRKTRQDREAKETAERKLAEERAKTRKRRVLTATMSLLTAIAAAGGWYGQRQAREAQAATAKTQSALTEAEAQKLEADKQRKTAEAALTSAKLQLERSQLEEGRAWLERGKAARNKGDHLSALMLAGRAVGYQGYGRLPRESAEFTKAFPLLLATPMIDPTAEQERQAEMKDLTQFIARSRDSFLPLWFAPGGSGTKLAFSPDGSRLASESWDGTIRLWDAACGKELAPLIGRTASVCGIAFNPDGTMLASGSSDGAINLWDLSSGELTMWIFGHTSQVDEVAFSPDGSRLASGSWDKSIKLWDSSTGKQLPSLAGHTEAVMGLAFSPDGSRLASASWDKTIKLWEASSGKELASLAEHTDAVRSVAFSPDGSRLASGSSDKTIKLWDAANGKELASFGGHADCVTSVAFSPDGSRLASASADTTIKLLDAASGKELTSLARYAEAGVDVAFSPDGSRLASISAYRTITLWDSAKGNELNSLTGHTSPVRSVAFSSDGSRLASISAASISPADSILKGSEIKLWDASSGKELATIIREDWPFVTDIAFSPDGSRLACTGYDVDIQLYDTFTGKKLSTDDKSLASATKWVTARDHRSSPSGRTMAEIDGYTAYIVPTDAAPDLAIRLREGWLAFDGRELMFPKVKGPTKMLHVRNDTYAQLANPDLTPAKRAELQMLLCTKAGQFRAATAQWRRLQRGEWPMGLGATGLVPREDAPGKPSQEAQPTSVPSDSEIRRLYLLALIDATKHPQIHGHPTICQAAEQIAPVLTKEMMATPTISLAMMSLMQTLAKDYSPDMNAPRTALLKRLEEVATKEWLAVLREGK